MKPQICSLKRFFKETTPLMTVKEAAKRSQGQTISVIRKGKFNKKSIVLDLAGRGGML